MGCCCVVARHAVSKKKNRTIDKKVPNGSVDLDLVQIHKNIICMGFPALGIKSLYRNRYKDTLRYIDYKYNDKYMVYNLCAEPEHQYNLNLFHQRVRQYPFPDHWACPLEMIINFISDAVNYLTDNSNDINNNNNNNNNNKSEAVVVIHCKAGKGRTGLLACCLLMAIEINIKESALIAIQYYGERRTSNGRGLTLPSQIRYVKYYEILRKEYNNRIPENIPMINLFSFQICGIESKLKLTSCKWYSGGESCIISLKLSHNEKFDITKSSKYITTVEVKNHLFFKKLFKDIRIEFLNGDQIIGALTFHTLFIQNKYNFTEIDKICKLKLPENACFSMKFASSL